jgi:hypothetical protein
MKSFEEYVYKKMGWPCKKENELIQKPDEIEEPSECTDNPTVDKLAQVETELSSEDYFSEIASTDEEKFDLEVINRFLETLSNIIPEDDSEEE